MAVELFADPLGDRDDDERVERREVRVDRARRHRRALCDRAYLHGVVPALRRELERRVHDPLSSTRNAHFDAAS